MQDRQNKEIQGMQTKKKKKEFKINQFADDT